MPGGKMPFIISFIGAIILCVIGYFSYKSTIEIPMIPTQNKETPVVTDIRPAAVAGSFYPSDAQELSEVIEQYLAMTSTIHASGTPWIIISPHAGYEYSGMIAGAAFQQVVGLNIERVIIVGRSHKSFFDGIAADDHDAWQTPLGTTTVDNEFIQQLAKIEPSIHFDRDIHAEEHSLEVMIPFIQKALGSNTKIVPLLFGNENIKTEKKLADVLSKLTDDATLIVISTDLSHYPSPDDARKLDGQTIDAILTNDADIFHGQLDDIMKKNPGEAETLACGETAVGLALYLSKQLGLKPYLIKYANSNDAHPESSAGVVGYGAITFNDINMPKEKPAELNSAEQKIALAIARKTLEEHFAGRDYEPETKNAPIFTEPRGVFVTLRKNGNLRGCIGLFESNKPLSENIRAMALAAAFEDNRFSPLTEDELDDIDIEVSVLTPMVKIGSIDKIKLGDHGVYIRRGRQSGVFLPQVATETGWDKKTFLDSLCVEKAGLEPGCYNNPNTEIYTFTAQVFEE